jgi:hypothetical protein
MRCAAAKKAATPRADGPRWQSAQRPRLPSLLLPSAFFVAISAQLFAAFMFVDLAFAAFL